MKQVLWILFIALGLSACGGGSKDSNPNNSSSDTTEIGSSSSSSPYPHFLVKFDGDNQLSQPNSILPIEPKVKVTDPSDQPLAGITVNFAITTGDGTIQNASAVTDSSGFASGGSWNPGNSIGLNTLTAIVEGLPPVIFNTRTGRSSSDIKLTAGATDGKYGRPIEEYHSSLTLLTRVESTYQIKSVTATANGIPINIQDFTFPKTGGTWASYFSDFNIIPSGPMVYVVTVTDIYDHTTDIVFPPMILDRGPTLSLNVEDKSVIQNSFDLTITCANALGDCSYVELDPPSGSSVRVNGNALVYPIDVSALAGREVSIEAHAMSKSGTYVYEYRHLFIEPSPLLLLFAKATDSILDISGNRVIFVDTPTQTNIPTLKILDVSTNTVQTIAEDHGLAFIRNDGGARFTEDGIIYAFEPWSSPKTYNNFIYEWKDNNTSQLSKMESINFSENANWLIYFDGDSFWKRNLSEGISTLISDIPNTVRHFAISSKGDVVWEADSLIYSLPASANTSKLVSDGSFPSTDGINIVYRNGECCNREIAVHNGTEETILSSELNGFPAYVMAGGYVAYMKDSQIWLYHNGNTQQLTHFGTASIIRLEAIAPNGAVSLTYNNKRYIKKPDEPLTEIGSALGKPFFSEERLFIIIRHTILEAAL